MQFEVKWSRQMPGDRQARHRSHHRISRPVRYGLRRQNKPASAAGRTEHRDFREAGNPRLFWPLAFSLFFSCFFVKMNRANGERNREELRRAVSLYKQWDNSARAIIARPGDECNDDRKINSKGYSTLTSIRVPLRDRWYAPLRRYEGEW